MIFKLALPEQRKLILSLEVFDLVASDILKDIKKIAFHKRFEIFGQSSFTG